MIYLDNSSTTLKKPLSVYSAVNRAMKNAGGYGRSGHKPAIYAGEIAYNCRENAQKLFSLQSPEQVIFTLNATHALNQAIYALTPFYKKIAISGYEHNSVVRPLYYRNLDYHVIKSKLFDQDDMLNGVKNALNIGCDLFIINHVSNVFGQIVPLKQIDDLLYNAGASMILDASQSAGSIKIDAGSLKSVKAICTAGHKGLLGAMGTGLLLVCTDMPFKPLMQGGTGSLSNDFAQPEIMPDRLESGTPNIVGIAGLSEGIKTVLRLGEDKILKHEQKLMRKTADELKKLQDIEVFVSSEKQNQSGVLSFRHKDISCEKIAESLADNDICVRAGLHCASLAHSSANTLETGTVRVSFGIYNTNKDIKEFMFQMQKIIACNDKI